MQELSCESVLVDVLPMSTFPTLVDEAAWQVAEYLSPVIDRFCSVISRTSIEKRHERLKSTDISSDQVKYCCGQIRYSIACQVNPIAVVSRRSKERHFFGWRCPCVRSNNPLPL